MAEYVVINKYIEDDSNEYSNEEVERMVVDWMEDIMNRYTNGRVI